MPGKSFVTTTMQAAMAYVLDAEIAQFIQERHVAYITGPMTSGRHYHHVHHHIHHFGHYHHTG
ncbi:MAG: hypothetical protein GYA24_20310 [Candidatus Lokiarchaeota archaeon]|nr:hypothetical protein [Candidatus Lokiarchaeota archaeon]